MGSGDDIRNISRREAVRLQIEMAIRARMMFDDPVSALTLAGSAERVLSDLQPQNALLGVDGCSIRAFINLYIRQEHQAEAAKLIRDSYDFLRHADRSPTRELELNVDTVDIFLILAMRAYSSIFDSSTSLMTAFGIWMMVERPDWLSESAAPDIKEFSRRAQNFRHLSNPEFFNSVLALVEAQSQIPNP